MQELHQEDGPLQGELTLLVRQHRGTMVGCIVAFRKLYPDVRFRVFYNENRSDSESYDVCISSTPPSEEYSQGKCLITEKLQLMVAAAHPLAARESVQIQELKNEGFALLDKNNSLWHHTEHLCHQAGFDPNISMICGDLHCMIQYVAAGMAVTLGPVVSWRGIQNDSVVFIPTVPQETRPTYVYWNEKKSQSKLHQTFLDFLVEYFAAQA